MYGYIASSNHTGKESSYEGIFDIEDLRFQTHELADFVEKSSKVYGYGDGNAFRFGGKSLISGINKYDFIFRTYDPSTGKFIQRDPQGYLDGTNMYVYTANNPLVFTDPYGMDKRPEQSINSGIAAARATNAPTDILEGLKASL
jgi:RHS repeat-associated protein